ncbi:MAG: nucleoside triphosphate pyrophosphatase [Pseudomonadota bacterium]
MSFILASGSASRRAILSAAGTDFQIDPADLDEAALSEAFQGPTEFLPLKLAEEKALAVSQRHKGALVLGADQILEFEGEVFGKASSAPDARERLARFRGQTHRLIGGIAAVRDGHVVWRFQSECRMEMRDFSDAFLDRYIENAGDILTTGVGAYAYEGLGAQLFSSVQGDYYAVLGLPLLPVLAMLREQGVLEE